jgi:hypothetical protein
MFMGGLHSEIDLSPKGVGLVQSSIVEIEKPTELLRTKCKTC